MANSQISKKSAKLTIEVLTGPQKGARRTFTQEEISIGRANENDFAIPDDAKMSRKHARILMTPEGFEIENITDKNLLFVDGAPTRREKIKNTQKILLGQTELAVNFDLFETQAPSILPATTPQESMQQVPASAAIENLQNPGQGQTSPMTQSVLKPTASGDIKHLQTRPAQNIGLQPSGSMTPAAPVYQQIPPRNSGMYQQPIYPTTHSHQESGVPLKVGLILIIGIVGIYFGFLQPAKRKPASDNIYRTSDVIQNDRDKVKKNLDDLDKKDIRLESLQFKRAQENLDKALRDYRNGQYGLARDKFLLVLSLDPLNQTAKRYEQLSRFKLDEQIKYYSLQGRKYYERQNYRLCASSFEKVIVLIQKKDDKQFQEAAEFLKLCQQSLNTRYE